MQGLFIHDHKFPRLQDEYYHSYGFDEEFFNRYLSIFDNLVVVGRETELKGKAEKVTSEINFLTINNLNQLKNTDVRNKISNNIRNSDYIVIRVPSILGLYAVEVAKKYKKPYLIEVVGCSWDAIANKGWTKVLPAALITLFMKRAIKSAEKVVYVTEEFLERRYPTSGEFIACSNVTLKEVSEKVLSRRLKRIKNQSVNNKVVIGTCATVDVVYKGQQDVIEALARLKDEGHNIEYQLVGGGDASYLKSVAKKYGVSDQVKFIGSLKHEEVFRWLEQIDIYVHPSKQEGLSRAIIEAMSTGCPVFGADAGGIHELIEDDFIFAKGNVRQIVDIYKKFNPEIMHNQAMKNHDRSKKYLKSVLYKRRTEFFNKFIQEYKN
jgi:glycosyltransferase involved in cell wall biosynthesis